MLPIVIHSFLANYCPSGIVWQYPDLLVSVTSTVSEGYSPVRKHFWDDSGPSHSVLSVVTPAAHNDNELEHQAQSQPLETLPTLQELIVICILYTAARE